MLKLSSQAIFRLHEFSNLWGILLTEVIVGVGLWHFISPWWLWLLVFVPIFLIISSIGARIFPIITSPIIESFRPDDDQFYTEQGEPVERIRKPLDETELLRVFIGLCLFGYVTIDSFFTGSMLGYGYDGFFRVYQAENPTSFWIYRSLCISGTLACIWGAIYLLTADRYRIDEDE